MGLGQGWSDDTKPVGGSQMSVRPRVLIVGGGFGGLAASKGLARAPVDVTVVDRTNHHLFQPLLYQVATAGLAPSDIAEPIRSLLARQRNVVVRLAEVKDIDLDRKMARIADPEGRVEWLAWDKLILAAGTRHSYFGHDEWSEHAPGLKTLDDALAIRKRVLTAFEKAEWTDDPEERAALMTFVVIGAGPTGVELAGAIAEIACQTLRKEFRRIDTTTARVILLEGADAVLPVYDPSLQASAKRQLESLGVTVRLGARVTSIDDAGVEIGDERIETRTVLWGAGVQGSALAKALQVPLDRAGRVLVQPDCSVPGHPDAFVVGDLAAIQDERTGSMVPGVAPAAMQMGVFVAEAIRADLNGKPRGTFRYIDRGSMATIGRSRAVADALGLKVSGFPAWLMWVFVHILFLITFRNRTLVMTKWAWAWFTWERATRLLWQVPAEYPEVDAPEQRATGT